MQDLWQLFLSNLIDNLTEGIVKIKCKDYDSWIWKGKRLFDKMLMFILQWQIVKDLKKRFGNTLNFSNNHINKFIFLWMNNVYPYEYIEEFCSNWKLEDISDADYKHAERFYKDFEK